MSLRQSVVGIISQTDSFFDAVKPARVPLTTSLCHGVSLACIADSFDPRDVSSFSAGEVGQFSTAAPSRNNSGGGGGAASIAGGGIGGGGGSGSDFHRRRGGGGAPAAAANDEAFTPLDMQAAYDH